jgi:hypothetical protein
MVLSHYSASTRDGFVSYADGTVKTGLKTVTVSSTTFDAERDARETQVYDVTFAV